MRYGDSGASHHCLGGIHHKEIKTMNLYKVLWSKIGGRPWTYIWRDIYHQAEFVIFALWFFIGIGVYIWLGFWGVMLFWIFFTYGYISGHFHWGTKYIEEQKGK